MKKNEDAAAKRKPKTSAAQIRVQKGSFRLSTDIHLLAPENADDRSRLLGYLLDLTELDLPSTMKTHFPDPTDLLNFTLTITPDEGMHCVFCRVRKRL